MKILKQCCICKHFRMWKPQESYCTVHKQIVDPLEKDKDCFVLRKGLKFFEAPKFKPIRNISRS